MPNLVFYSPAVQPASMAVTKLERFFVQFGTNFVREHFFFHFLHYEKIFNVIPRQEQEQRHFF